MITSTKTTRQVISQNYTFFGRLPSNCWWKKSCTSWWVVYPIIYRVLYIPGGEGFLPSTVSRASPLEPWEITRLSAWLDICEHAGYSTKINAFIPFPTKVTGTSTFLLAFTKKNDGIFRPTNHRFAAGWKFHRPPSRWSHMMYHFCLVQISSIAKRNKSKFSFWIWEGLSSSFWNQDPTKHAQSSSSAQMSISCGYILHDPQTGNDSCQTWQRKVHEYLGKECECFVFFFSVASGEVH